MLGFIPILALAGVASATTSLHTATTSLHSTTAAPQTTSSAQTTLNITFVAISFSTLDASIVGKDDSATTLLLKCHSNATATEDCGLPQRTLLYTGATDTMAYTWSTTLSEKDTAPTEGIYKVDCSLYSKNDTAWCTGQSTVYVQGTSTTRTKTWKTKQWMENYLTNTVEVLVTAGADKLNAAEATTTKAKSSEATAASASGSGTESTSTSTNSDNAAGPAITQHVAAAGVAALLGGAALLL